MCVCHRWIEVISSATSSAHMTRLFSRMESNPSYTDTEALPPRHTEALPPRPEVSESDVI